MTVLVTGTEINAVYGIPQGTLRRWVHEGKLTRYGPPRQTLYDLEELGDLLDKRPNGTVSSVGVLHPENPAPSPAEEEPPVGPSHERGTT